MQLFITNNQTGEIVYMFDVSSVDIGRVWIKAKDINGDPIEIKTDYFNYYYSIKTN